MDPSPAGAPVARVAAVCRDLREVAEHRRTDASPIVAGGDRPGASAPATSLPGGAAADPMPGLLAQLRAATTVYVCGLQAAGARPEQVLVQVKALVREAMAAEGWNSAEATEALTVHVVRWSIAAYYER